MGRAWYFGFWGLVKVVTIGIVLASVFSPVSLVPSSLAACSRALLLLQTAKQASRDRAGGGTHSSWRAWRCCVVVVIDGGLAAGGQTANAATMLALNCADSVLLIVRRPIVHTVVRTHIFT